MRLSVKMFQMAKISTIKVEDLFQISIKILSEVYSAHHGHFHIILKILIVYLNFCFFQVKKIIQHLLGFLNQVLIYCISSLLCTRSHIYISKYFYII